MTLYLYKNCCYNDNKVNTIVSDGEKAMSKQTGMPSQNIINYYLLDCVKENKKIKISFSDQE